MGVKFHPTGSLPSNGIRSGNQGLGIESLKGTTLLPRSFFFFGGGGGVFSLSRMKEDFHQLG